MNPSDPLSNMRPEPQRSSCSSLSGEPGTSQRTTCKVLVRHVGSPLYHHLSLADHKTRKLERALLPLDLGLCLRFEGVGLRPSANHDSEMTMSSEGSRQLGGFIRSPWKRDDVAVGPW